jgi:hypothetical protein
MLRIPSKFDLRRFCRATNSTALVKLEPPTPDALGFAKSLEVAEIGGTTVSVLRQDPAQVLCILRNPMYGCQMGTKCPMLCAK